MKTKKYLSRLAISLGILSLLSFGIFQLGEDPFITSLKNLVINYEKNVPFEKVYLHIDRPFYKPGDDIWFKAYLTNTNNMPSTRSDVIHVELINPKGTIEKSLTLQTLHGICFGDFALDESAAGGLYKIKAYTNWMHNFGDDYFFEKEIQVQKVVYSRVLSKLDFKRENFAPGDTVKAELSLESLENIPLTFQSVDIDISLNGSKYKSFNATTDNKGKLQIAFHLPANVNTNDGLVNVKIQHEGSVEAISRAIPIILNKISLQFFPEGGYWVNNVPCKVAFKALNEFGKPADVEGFITDETGNVVTSLISFHQGMGAVELTAFSGKHYYATITKPQVTEKFPLPDASAKGYVLKVNKQTDGKYNVQVYSPTEQKMHVVVQSGKVLCFSKTIQTTKGINQLEFSSSRFPAGIGTVTLFDQDGVPRCERLVYFNYHKQLNVSLQFDKQKYLPREKVNLKIKTTDNDSIPVSANLSLSVVNDQLYTFADDKQHNILSWLLLGSEIKGKIEKPDFYFKKDEPKAEKALDYLLLTQGWRRYKWGDLLTSNYNVTSQAQRIGCISGRIINKTNNEPIMSEVTILELDNQKRALKVNTGKDGKFRFLDVDANSSIQLLARSDEAAPGNISIIVDELNGFENNKQNIELQKFQIIPEVIKEKVQGQRNNFPKEKIRGNAERDNIIKPAQVENGMVLNEDVKKLEEVMVVGYGAQKKSDLTGSVIVVESRELNRLTQMANFSQGLEGRVAGLDIISNSGGPGANPQILIRGGASLGGKNPLYVIDGAVYDESLSGTSHPLENLPISDIKEISVLKDAAASAIYGSKGANGVIIITTNSNRGNFKTIKRPFFPKYKGIVIGPRKASYTREFYFPVYEKEQQPEERSDFRSTVYWNPNINTNTAGEASVEFYASDEITSFRAIAEGIGSNGCVGRKEEKYFSQLPFSMATKFPAYLSFGDTVMMPLIIKNNTQSPLKGQLNFLLPDGIIPVSELPKQIEMNANTSYTLSIPFLVSNIAGKDTLSVSFTSDKHKDAFIQEVDIQPKGFPTKLSFSSKNKEENGIFTINKPVTGSIRAEFTAFPDLLSDMLSGVESILREPYGCFEQTSSSTYPNIMVLQYLFESGQANNDISSKATDLIKKGYNRLVGFETNEKGYEWFGRSPAHEGLTAYGLMEFVDMSNVYNGVDKTMIKRTLNWILSKRDRKGGFERSAAALDQFGRASEAVTRAYIIYALSEAHIDQVEMEYQTAFDEAKKSSDPYRLALMANAAYNFKKTKDGD